jgi:hypothetical protein
MKIQGLTTDSEGQFYFVTGTGKVFRTHDFSAIDPVLVTPRRLSDVNLRSTSENGRP